MTPLSLILSSMILVLVVYQAWSRLVSGRRLTSSILWALILSLVYSMLGSFMVLQWQGSRSLRWNTPLLQVGDETVK